MKGRAALEAHLDRYWKLEALNIPLLTGTMLLLARGQVGGPALLGLVAMNGVLAIGAVYWRAKRKQLAGDRAPLRCALPWMAALQTPTAIVVAASALVAIAAWSWPEMSVGLADRVVASVAATMAVLEYVNYFHRQLQHFDQRADWARLMSGRGFRRSWLSRDLAAHRRRRA
ncbi:MAG: hypothetical protein AAGH15_08490 [Myxococcota bacterium]